MASSRYGQVQLFLSIADPRSTDMLHLALLTPLIPKVPDDPPLWNSFIVPVEEGLGSMLVPISDITAKMLFVKFGCCAYVCKLPNAVERD